MHYKKRQRDNDAPMLLPLDYHVGPDTVMIGRGRKCINNEGNRRFRAMVKVELREYSAGRKAKKSSIIKRILREIRNNCDDGIGFVKQDALTGRFYTATETAAKVTIAQAFRDCLHEHGYKSSKQHKQYKRDVAKGKLNPEDGEPIGGGGDEEAICLSCKEEDRFEEAATAAHMKAAGTAADEDEGWESVMNNIVVTEPRVYNKEEEPSLDYWECNQLLPPLTSGDSGKVASDYSNAKPTATGAGVLPPPAFENLSLKEADPFEPIPLRDALEIDFTSAIQQKTEAPGMQDTDTSESDSSHCSHNTGCCCDDDVDEEEAAIIAWSCEFVNCPRCSHVEGRGHFEELPIADIREALIG